MEIGYLENLRKKGKTKNLPSGWYHTGTNESGNRVSCYAVGMSVI